MTIVAEREVAGSRVLIVEDDEALSGALAETLRIAKIPCLAVADLSGAVAALENETIDLVVTDVNLAGSDGFDLLRTIQLRNNPPRVVMMTAFGTIERAVEAMKGGAADYLQKPFRPKEFIECVRKHRDMPVIPKGFVAEDPATVELTAVARQVGATAATVLLLGESGVGKEVFSRYIHDQSSRASGPFVALNCAAIPESMLEAVMFGHEKGAFTGALRAQAGKFEQANGGTLLLDEISEMALPLQAKLLRVIQEREVERVGGSDAIALDVRIIATTNRDLSAQVRSGEFREDLYYRLNVFPLQIPPLRERPGDILPIVDRLLAEYGMLHNRRVTFSHDARTQLLRHRWPGNVRELDNVVQRSLILCRGDEIPAAVVTAMLTDGPCAPSSEEVEPSLRSELRQTEHSTIAETLQQFEGNRKKTAAALGISERTLRYKMQKLREQGLFVA